MHFGEQLKLLREAQGLTQAELAERVSLSRAAISLYEAGAREPRHSEVRRLADGLGVKRSFFDEDDLWAEVEEALAQAKRILLGARTADNTPFVRADINGGRASYPGDVEVPGTHTNMLPGGIPWRLTRTGTPELIPA